MKNQKGFVPIVIIVTLFVIGGLVGAFYLGKVSNKPTKVPDITPSIYQSQPLSISPTPDPTANWKTYKDQSISFKYPQEWSLSGYLIISNSPKIRLAVTPKESTLMNECMEMTSTETKNSVFIKRFKRVTTGAMCETSDSTPQEIWVIPSATSYSPGISYRYSSTESAQAEPIFDQILSTFRFDSSL